VGLRGGNLALSAPGATTPSIDAVLEAIMDGISMNTNPSTLYASQPTNQGAQRNDEANGQQFGQNSSAQQRVNEGASTVTTFSPQALELSQQERNPPVNQPGQGASVGNGPESGQQSSAAQQSGSSGEQDQTSGGNQQGRSSGFETPSGNEARRPLDSEVTNDILRT
jgi:hypothetical protein